MRRLSAATERKVSLLSVSLVLTKLCFCPPVGGGVLQQNHICQGALESAEAVISKRLYQPHDSGGTDAGGAGQLSHCHDSYPLVVQS